MRTSGMVMPMMRSLALVFALSMAAGFAAEPANWPNWRGPGEKGSIEHGKYPVKWDPSEVAWKAPLPGKGCSTPVIWGERIFVTAPVEGKDAVLAFDLQGKSLWQTKFGPEDAGKHRNGSGSNPSPATDGKGVFVYYKSGTLASLDLDGKVRWQTNLVAAFGPDNLYWDQGTSPALTKDLVILARMHHGDSWLAAFDKQTGQMRWKVARNYETPVEGDHAYTTPLVIEHEGKEALLVWGAQHLTAHETTDGKLLWSCGDFNPKAVGYWPAVASPVVSGDFVAVSCGRADRGQPRFYGVRLGGKGDVTSTHKVWYREDTGTFVPTPAAYKGKLYLVRDRGEVECVDPATGKTVWQEAFPRASSNYYSSPLIANGVLYGIREDGMVFVARVEDKFELLSEIKMGERIIASPVPLAPGRLLIRGERNLFCIAGN